MRNLPHGFDIDLVKVKTNCGLLRKAELYHTLYPISELRYLTLQKQDSNPKLQMWKSHKMIEYFSRSILGHTYDEYMAWNLAAFLTISTLKAEADLERIADYGNMGCYFFKGGCKIEIYAL